MDPRLLGCFTLKERGIKFIQALLKIISILNNISQSIYKSFPSKLHFGVVYGMVALSKCLLLITSPVSIPYYQT